MNEPAPPTGRIRELSIFDKLVFGLGDLTVNTALSAMSLVYTSYFLTQVAGLRPVLAGLVPLIGRVIDAVIDPLMGRLSDHTRFASGRRRPYLLIGAIPFGASFALMWVEPTFLGSYDGQLSRFVYYSLAYLSVAFWMTVLSIPYMALIPEMAVSYDARTSLNSYRNLGSMLGLFVAISIRPFAESLGGGAAGFAIAGALVGAALIPPWLAVHRVTFERPGFHGEADSLTMREGLRLMSMNAAFRRLLVIFLTGRIAMDVIGALLILYVTFWLGRSQDFEPVMLGFLGTVLLVLPIWLRLSRGREKHHIFAIAAVMWMAGGLLFLFADPGWSTTAVVGLACVSALGYCAVDLMPWAMLGEVIDADEDVTGERRDGLYNGFFTFFRKLAGALGVFLVLSLLDLLGFQRGETQSETVRQAIRWMTFLAPGFFLAIGAVAAIGYPLSRARHDEISARLEARRAQGAAETNALDRKADGPESA